MQVPLNSFSKIEPGHQDVEIRVWHDDDIQNFLYPQFVGFHQLFMFQKGGGIHEIGFEEFEILDNSFHLVPARTIHCIKSRKRLRGILIKFTDVYRAHLSHFDFSVDSSYFGKDRYIYDAPTAEFKNIYEAVQRLESDLYLAYNRSLLISQITVLLLKIISSHHVDINLPKNKFVSDFLSKVNVHLSPEYRNKPNPKKIAKQLGIQEEQMNYILKTYLGKSLLQLQRRSILAAAKDFLFNSEMSTKDVAEQLYFRNESEFCKFFLRYAGVSANEYAMKRSDR